MEFIKIIIGITASVYLVFFVLGFFLKGIYPFMKKYKWVWVPPLVLLPVLDTIYHNGPIIDYIKCAGIIVGTIIFLRLHDSYFPIEGMEERLKD